MIDVPTATPVTTPVTGSTPATAGVTLVHVPVGVGAVRVMVGAGIGKTVLHTLNGPISGDGVVTTATVLVATADPQLKLIE